MADLGHDRRIRAGLPARSDGPRPVDEQAGRCIGGLAGLVDGERTDRVFLLAGQVERSPAGDDEARPRRRSKQRRDVTGGADDLFEVVEDEQQRPPGQEPGERLGGGALDSVEQAERSGDRRPDDGRVGDGLEGDEPRAVRDGAGAISSQLDGEAGLADATRSGQGDQAVRVEEATKLVELPRPADEAGQSLREVAGRRVRDPERREVDPPTRHVDLEQVLGDRDVLEDVPAQVADRERTPDLGRHEGVRRPRQDDLAAVADGRDAGGAVDVEPAVVVPGKVRLAGVQAHPNPNLAVVRPAMGVEGALAVDRGIDRRAGLGEDREHGITLGPDADAAVALHGVAEDLEMRSR